MYVHLNTTTNFTFLTGASHPQEYIKRAHELNYQALAITDECSLAGIVKAFVEAKKRNFKMIVGSRFTLSNRLQLIALAPSRKAYAELSGFISLTRRRSDKGQYEAHFDDLRFRLQHCLIIWVAHQETEGLQHLAYSLAKSFKNRLWIGIDFQYAGDEQKYFSQWEILSKEHGIPLVACSEALMHKKYRKPLQDSLTAIKYNCSIKELGTKLKSNGENYLKPVNEYYDLFSDEMIQETLTIANRCEFSLSELQYQYPKELVPSNLTPIQYLRSLVEQGKKDRWGGTKEIPNNVNKLLEKELRLIEELNYEYYFLTVYDIVKFAKEKQIFCQGRGSAANSVVCYCLHITEISPSEINVLFERFISKERNEPPDIDVDFEHQRREEVIQYIYQKYGRERAAIAATVVTYRSRSAIRDIGKALDLAPSLIDHLAKSLAWWDRQNELQQRIQAAGLEPQKELLLKFFYLVKQILGFPRHLSQHVGGFIIAQSKVSDLVPLENASMPDRTVIQWDKEDLENMQLLKVDVLSLGMLTALRKALSYVNVYKSNIKTLQDIPREDPDTYEMLSQGNSVGVFQVESRAQMSMLPRLQPRNFYDLVIEIAIVRPGPIQGDMVHPYLRRRNKQEPVTYFNDEIKSVLKRTLGIPIFQEQAIKLSMVAAGFSGGEADELRRAMASWVKNGNLLKFEEKFIQGMLKNNYPLEFAQRLFEQIKGFGGYGFPESHSASFALLCYASSWLKCHHPAAFYCSLLNSQPMGFYSPSQLVQDARRQKVELLPVDINKSKLENSLEKIANTKEPKKNWAIRLGFCRIKSLNHNHAQHIETARANKPFNSLEDLVERTQLSSSELQLLASADALRTLTGNRHISRWQALAIKPYSHLLSQTENPTSDKLFTQSPSIEKDIVGDYRTTGLSLRVHPMALLRQEAPFNRCKTYQDLFSMSHGRFVRVAGLVTGRQRPGTAKGTLFLTLEDETGNINIVVWKHTQENFRQALLTGKLLLIKGTVEISEHKPSDAVNTTKVTPTNASPNDNKIVIHVVAGQIIDYSQRLSEEFNLKSRDFH